MAVALGLLLSADITPHFHGQAGGGSRGSHSTSGQVFSGQTWTERPLEEDPLGVRSTTFGQAPLSSGAPRANRPPKGTIRVPSRYVKRYRAKRANWNEVINSGKRLSKVSARCAARWRKSGKDRRLKWKSVNYRCMSGLRGKGYLPQGVAGSATTRRYHIGNTPAANRDIILTSWYSRSRERGLFASNRAGGSVTRLLVVDMRKKRYNKVELVRPDGRNTLRHMDSHGSGLVWAGQYLYLSSNSVLFMFNADDVLKIRGRFVLPAVARWTVHGRGGLSSISIDRSASPDVLMGINYSKNGQAFVQSFKLRKSGLLASHRRRTADPMSLRNRWGEKGRVVRSVRSLRIPGTNYQGVGGAGRYIFANSSGLRVPPRKRKVDAVVVFRSGRLIARFRMPRRQIQSMYIDYKRGRYISIAEGGSQFLFAMPLRRIVRKAG